MNYPLITRSHVFGLVTWGGRITLPQTSSPAVGGDAHELGMVNLTLEDAEEGAVEDDGVIALD